MQTDTVLDSRMRKNVNLAAVVTVSNLRMRVREVLMKEGGADKVRKSDDERT